MFKATNYAGSKLCQPGDMVINILRAWMSDHTELFKQFCDNPNFKRGLQALRQQNLMKKVQPDVHQTTNIDRRKIHRKTDSERLM